MRRNTLLELIFLVIIRNYFGKFVFSDEYGGGRGGSRGWARLVGYVR